MNHFAVPSPLTLQNSHLAGAYAVCAGYSDFESSLAWKSLEGKGGGVVGGGYGVP